MRQFIVIWILVAVTLWIQSAGLAVFIHWARTSVARMHGMSVWRTHALMTRFTVAMIVLHLVEILFWSAFYRWQCFPTWESAFYFSAASYSTVGYGDVVLPRVWRTLGPIESVTGVLMCGISVSVLFAIATRLVGDGSGSAFSFVNDQARDTVDVDHVG